MSEFEKLSQLKLIWIGLAEYCRTSITDNQVKMYAEDLMKYSLEDVASAIVTFKAIPDNRFLPMPSQLMALIFPVETERDIGQVVAARIMTALSKFGNYPPGPEKAKEWLGPLAWEVVKSQGGWESFKLLTTAELKAEQPRLRDLAISLHKRARLGKLHEAPALPKSSQETSRLVTDTFAKKGIGYDF